MPGIIGDLMAMAERPDSTDLLPSITIPTLVIVGHDDVLTSPADAERIAKGIPGAKLVRQEKTVMGSYYGTANTARDFPLYAQLWKQGRLPLEKLISHRYPLDRINQAYKAMLDGSSRRGVIVFD